MKAISALLLAATLAVIPQRLAPPADAATAAAARPACDGHRATIVGTDVRERLTGTAGRDVIVGGAGGDRIDGRGGNDLICGGVGGDRISGGDGDDRIFGELGGAVPSEGGFRGVGDRITPGRGADFISPGSDDTYQDSDTLDLSGAPRRVVVDLPARTVRGEGGDTLAADFVADVVGTAYDDRMRAGVGGARFYAGPGDDEFVGGPGTDGMVGGAGDDRFDGGPSPDRVWPGPGHDVIDGGEDDDVIDDRDRDVDEIHGGPGDDRLSMFFVHADGQVVDGGEGMDRAYLDTWRHPETRPAEATTDLGAGTTTLPEGRFAVTRDLELLFGGPALHWTVHGTDADEEVEVWRGIRLTVSLEGGEDRVFGGDREDVLDGGDGDDDLRGGRRADLLAGGPGDDFFVGERGDDTLDGGEGQDGGFAGPGEDTCHSVEEVPDADCEHVD